MRYSIVIPTLNERDNMAPLLSRIDSCGLSDYEIIVVDNGGNEENKEK